MEMNKEEIKRAAKIALARKDFWTFCKCVCPKIYNKEHIHLKSWCNMYQNWYENKNKKFLVFNAPPRHGKSLTAQLFSAWILGINREERVMVLCYSKDLSVKFSKQVRKVIMAYHIDDKEENILFCDIFPDIKIRRGDGAASQWSLEDSSTTSFFACSIGSTITGFGASLLIIDDVVKGKIEAYNEEMLTERYEDIRDTVLQSRVEEGGRVVCSSTRWAKFDISGKIMEDYEDECEVHILKALQDDGTMLCPAFLSLGEYNKKKVTGDPVIFLANFQQELIEKQGRLYGLFKTWKPEDLPIADEKGRTYLYTTEALIDTADRGTDYFACIIYYPLKNGKIFVNDIIYTQKPGTEIEDELIKSLKDNKTALCIMEGNNGGTIFKESVKKTYNRIYGNGCSFKFFMQTKNKESRILNQAPWVEENVYFPEGWEKKYPDFYIALLKFQRDFKSNKHDDAADVVTMIADRWNTASSKGLKIYS